MSFFISGKTEEQQSTDITRYNTDLQIKIYLLPNNFFSVTVEIL